MRTIPLTQGQSTIVDDADYEALSQHKWYANKVRNTWYAARAIGSNKVLMHREILRVPKGMETDHKNHDGLDNRRQNLSICTTAQNQQNMKYSGNKNKTSRFKGVYFQAGKWAVQIKHQGTIYPLGRFAIEEDAARAYDKKARELWGDFAYLNLE